MKTKLPPTDTGVCGQPPGAKRHYRRGEAACEPCLEAARIQREKHRATYTNDATNELAQEVIFLLSCGEGTGRVLQATGYTGREKTLIRRLGRAGHHELAKRLFEEERTRWSRTEAA